MSREFVLQVLSNFLMSTQSFNTEEEKSLALEILRIFEELGILKELK